MKLITSSFQYTVITLFLLLASTHCTCSTFKFPPAYSFKTTKDNITLKVSTKKYNANLWHLLKKSRLLRKYNVIEIEITNNNNDPFELNANSITQNIHSLKTIQNRVRLTSFWNKVLLSIGYFLSGIVLGLGIAGPAYEWKEYEEHNGMRIYQKEAIQFWSIMSGLLGMSTCLGLSTKDILSQSNTKKRMQDLLSDKILEPNDTIIIAPGATVHRFLFCPRETFNPHFSITLMNQKTSERITFTPLKDKYK